MSEHEFDVAVVGGAVAGCTAAVLFARAGLRVALVERHAVDQGHKQLCTHYIQPCATDVIRRLGIEPALHAAGAIPNAVDMWTPWGWINEPALTDSSGERLFGYNITRRALDPMMRQLAAATAGITPYFGCTLAALDRDDHGNITALRIRGAADATLSARLVVAADGRNSSVARLAGIAAQERPNTRGAVFAQYRNLGRARGTRSQMWLTGPDVAYIFPNEDDVSVVACMPSRQRLAEFRDDPAGALERLVQSLDDHPDFSAAERISEVYTVKDYPNLLREPAHANIGFVGDTCLSLDPLFGVGCGWAFQSAAWLADACVPALTAEHPVATGLARYTKRHRHALRGHVWAITDFSRRRGFNPLERLMFGAAADDAATAKHVGLFAARVTGLAQFLSPRAVARAAAVRLKRALSRHQALAPT